MDYSSDYVTPVHIVNLAISVAAGYVSLVLSQKIIEEYPGNIILGLIWPGITLIWFFVDRFFKTNIISKIKNRVWKNLWHCLLNFVTINLVIISFNYWLDIVKRLYGLTAIPPYNLFVIVVIGITFLFYIFQGAYMKKRKDIVCIKRVLEMVLYHNCAINLSNTDKATLCLNEINEELRSYKREENKSQGVHKRKK